MTHPLHGPNRFKLGIFSANADGGLTVTRVPERWAASWDQIVEVAQLADRAGIDFFLPIARWKGFGGAMNSREWSFETLTFAAALAGLTERIALFSTVHLPMVHPVYAAKALATVDHASHGRAGINLVCGWNPDEFAMFGLTPESERYAQGREWFEILERIYTADAPFDFTGRYFDLRNVAGKPRPVQQPRPVTLNAAFSPAGRDFAASCADFLLTTMRTLEDARAPLDDMRTRASHAGREIGVLTTCHVVCRPSLAEAEDYYQRVTVEFADEEGADLYMASKEQHSASHDSATYRLHRQRFIGGGGTYPLIGTPAMITDELVRMAEIGLAGTTVSFTNFRDELPFFIEGVLPRLARAGMRQA